MIVWREGLSVWNPVIDADHKMLIALINDFEQAGGDDATQKVLAKLRHYADEHFAREEGIQASCQFPYAEAHRRAHRQLSAALSDILRKWEHSASLEDRGEIRAATASLLRDWLINHIVGEDLRMRNFVGFAPQKRH